MSEEKLLKNTERASLAMRALYRSYGYLPYKMSKFEEYELYVRNKDFLVSDNIITFNDTDGALLAMKPDVTLSIIKSTTPEPGCKQKLYYNENVYRVSHKTHRFKEIMQSGLECIGDIDIVDIHEAVLLALESLSLVSEDFVLDISHLGVLSKVLESASSDPAFIKAATRLIADKNKHEISELCREWGVSSRSCDTLRALADMYGEADELLAKLRPICQSVGADAAYSELSELCTLLSGSPLYKRVRIDFSVVNDMNYYNGIVFRGFVNGIPEGILSGGEYGKLAYRMGRGTGAVGFALYLDMLEELYCQSSEYDVDTLIVYGKSSDVGAVAALRDRLIAEGKSVSLQRAVPTKLRYKEIIKMD